MAKSIRNIQFPFGGLNRRYGYQNQPPYTTPDCLNVVPRSGINRRQVGSSRPGLMDGIYGVSSSKFLTSMTSIVTTDRIIIEDLFVDGSDSYLSWNSNNDQPSMIDNELVISSGDCCSGKWASMLQIADSTKDKMAEIRLHPDPDTGYVTGEYVLALYAGGISWPYYSYLGWWVYEGIVAIIEFNGSGSATITINVRGPNLSTGDSELKASYTGTYSSNKLKSAGWLQFEISGTTTKIRYADADMLSHDLVSDVSDWSKAVWPSIGMRSRSSSETCYIDGFRYQYHTTSERQSVVQNLISYGYYGASGPGILTDKTYRERMEVQTETLELSNVLATAEHLQKLYIADHNDAFNMAGSSTIYLDTVTTHKNYIRVTGMDWSAAGVNKDKHLAYVVTANEARAVKIHSVGTIDLYLDADDLTCGACTYQVYVSSKYYDSTANTLNHWMADYGIVPIGCKIMCRYRDRIVLAGSNDMPNIWYMSRAGDPFDWDYFQPDAGRAFGGTNNEAGEIGDEITALIPHTDDYLIFGCRNSMWMLRGDPAYGGSLEPINRQIGIVGPNAWCYGPDGEVVALTTNGLYLFAPGGQSYPVAISPEMIPNDLRGFTKDDANVSMAYDLEFNCVIILAGEAKYWFDWESKTFWPLSLSGSSVCGVNGRAYIDGYRFYNRIAVDGYSSISNYVKIGPIKLGDGYSENVLTEMIGTLTKRSGPVTWSVHVDDSPEDVIDKTALFSGTWSAGRNLIVRPRARGNNLMIKLTGASKRPWSLEDIVSVAKQGGKIR